METISAQASRELTLAAVSVAAAIGVFGVVYGAAARPILGAGGALVSSVLIFSGAAQFTLIALLAAGGSAAGVVGGVAILALRHLPLGAMVRPALAELPRPRRALLSLVLLDETVGLALARPAATQRTLALSGVAAYLAWVLGTAAGVVGASLEVLEPLAEALFPVLFVGLATLASRTRGDRARAVVAVLSSLLLLLILPEAGALGVLAVAVAAASLPPAR